LLTATRPLARRFTNPTGGGREGLLLILAEDDVSGGVGLKLARA
jgi:hypothetical protein